MNKNTILAIGAGAVACAGLAINVLFDRDNIYDMTLMALWVATLALAFSSAAFSRRLAHASMVRWGGGVGVFTVRKIRGPLSFTKLNAR